MNETRMAAFVEYVLRPLSEDWRQILQELRQLNIGITQQTVKEVTFAVGCWHLVGEIIRALSYVAVTWVICQTIRGVL